MERGRRLISEGYRTLNAELHAKKPKYGAGGAKWAPMVFEIARVAPALSSVLDYGCGKGDLKFALRHTGIDVAEYDPGIPGKEGLPEPADIVLCADVMEHVEPEHVEAVLDHVLSLAKQVVVMCICFMEGSRRLPDGRLAHLTVQPETWWFERISQCAARYSFSVGALDMERDGARTWMLEKADATHV